VYYKEFVAATTRRELSSQLASQFDPLGMALPFLLEGKLILQRVAASGADWDEVLPTEIQECWKRWLGAFKRLHEFSIPRNCFSSNKLFIKESAVFQLHAFCNASNSAFGCVVYLRCLVNGEACVSFMLGKSSLVLAHQSNWIISRKELEAAKLCSELMLLAQQAVRHLNCSMHFWADSQVVLGWITNSDLNLARFVKRRVDKILFVASSQTWNYVNTTENQPMLLLEKLLIKNQIL